MVKKTNNKKRKTKARKDISVREIKSAGVAGLFLKRANRKPEDVACWRREGDEWLAIAARDLRKDVVATSKGLLAKGVAFGEKIGIQAGTRYEWIVLDLAISLIGAVSVPIYETSSDEQIRHIREETEMEMIFGEAELDGLAELWKGGTEIKNSELAKRTKRVKPRQTMSIVYTSGTTSAPKGVELTHGNFIGVITGLTRESFPDGPAHYIGTEESKMLQFLPLSHVLARLVTHGIIGDTRASVGFEPDMGRIVKSFQEFKPTNIVAAPRVLEKVLEGARKKAGKGAAAKIFVAAERLAIKKTYGRLRGIDILADKIFDRLVFAKLRAAMGGELKYIVAGGAALNDAVERVFTGIGLNVMAGYGLTESSGPITLSRANETKFGSVGKPVMGSEVKIAKDGEILLKGPGVFPRYFKGASARGWFKTGDLGRLDGDGSLYIEGRKKDIIVTSYGKNVNYPLLEEELMKSPLVAQAIVVGDGRPCVMGILTVDEDGLRDWSEGKSLGLLRKEEILRSGAFLNEVRALKDAANSKVSRAEAIREIAVLPDEWTAENGFLTPTLKPRRPKIISSFSTEIEKLYQKKPGRKDRYAGADEVFDAAKNGENVFIGAVAIKGETIYPRAYEAVNNLRFDVYTKVGKTDPKLVFDDYDEYSAQMAAIDRRGGEAKILYAFRVILHDGKKDIGLFLEPNYESGDYFPGEKLAERRGEIGRFVSGHATEKRKKSAAEKARWMFSAERYRLMALKAALYAKALRDYGGDRTGYAEIADDLFAGLSRLGLVEKISKAKVFAVPNDGKARFVVRFKEDSGKKLERNIKKLEIFTGKLDLKDDFHKIRG